MDTFSGSFVQEQELKNKLFTYFTLALTGFFSLLSLLMLVPFLKPILWAIIFALVLYPIHLKLRSYIKSNALSALILSLGVLILVVVPFGLVVAVALRQSVDVINYIVNFTQQGQFDALKHKILTLPVLKGFLGEELTQSIESYLSSDALKNALLNSLREQLQKLVGLMTKLVPIVIGFFFKSFVFLLTLFFILKDGPRFIEFGKRFLPMHEEDVQSVFLTIYKTILATVYGAIGVATAQGLVSFLGYKLAGIEYATLLSVFTFFSSFIPPFGAGFVWFPTVIYLFFDRGLTNAVILLLYGMLIISTIDNIVRPLIMKLGLNIPYIALFFSIVGGLLTFGFVGIFLGPLIFTTLFSLALIYERRVLLNENSKTADESNT
ncbi:MAG: AI-2E family transporter [Aquificaceae bacterium]|nr:AI-2E family transporter [Aquificaceae bacterium]